MRTPSPRQIILITSSIISLACLAFYFLINFAFNLHIPLYFLVANPLVVFVLSFLILRYTMERFVNSKIKIIYKTIGKPRKFYRELRDNNRNIIKTVEHDVAEWAINKNKQIRELKKLETYRREFVGNVSHELKTPIFNALGYLETLEDDEMPPDMRKKYLQKAIDNVERLDMIVKDLEDISKYESGSLNLHLEAFDLVELVRDILSNMKIMADEQDIRLQLLYEKHTPIMVWADKSRIEQVLVNLISNSIKYGKYGGTTEIQFYDLDEQVLVEVTDNGPGIEEGDLPRLFERFFRAEKSRARKMGGTGLGLSIVKNIIESHHQIINVRSEIGIGTTFGFTLEKYIPE